MMKIVAGNSNRPLAEAICSYLSTPMTKAVVKRFNDMEIFVEIQENVRGQDMFVVQSTSFPANDHLMELLINEMLRQGAIRQRIRAHLYGGANLREGMAPIGTANAAFARAPSHACRREKRAAGGRG